MDDPGRKLCTTCFQDLTASRFDEASDAWLYECRECRGVDGPLTLEVLDPQRPDPRLGHGRGVMDDLDVYDGLLRALGRCPGRWLEHGVVEHLFAQAAPDAYRTLVDRYGHVAIAPGENTASWMLGRALWALKRENQVLVMTVPRGTGRWAYLAPCNAWSLPGVSANSTVVTWEAFAVEHEVDPMSHPAIDWRDTPNAAPVGGDLEGLTP